MVVLTEIRKTILNRRLISTVSLPSDSGRGQKKEPQSGSQGKTGRKIRPIRQAEKLSESRQNPDAHSNE
jgi:hypothetical protein